MISPMTESEGDLGRRLRANRGRRRRHRFTARIERAIGTRVTERDVLDLATTDRLAEAVAARIKAEHPTRTWPKSQREAVFEHLGEVAQQLDPDHSSCLILFQGWDDLGAFRLRSADACAHGQALWDEGAEALCLVTQDLSDGLYLDYTESEQMNGDDEYELWTWGAFAPE